MNISTIVLYVLYDLLLSLIYNLAPLHAVNIKTLHYYSYTDKY